MALWCSNWAGQRPNRRCGHNAAAPTRGLTHVHDTLAPYMDSSCRKCSTMSRLSSYVMRLAWWNHAFKWRNTPEVLLSGPRREARAPSHPHEPERVRACHLKERAPARNGCGRHTPNQPSRASAPNILAAERTTTCRQGPHSQTCPRGTNLTMSPGSATAYANKETRIAIAPT